MDFSKLFSAMITGFNLPFTVVMFFLFFYSLYICFKKDTSKVKRNLAKAAPTLLTSIGIFGTFFGIVIALLNFNDNNIREQINVIIVGMQTAFITSVMGVFLSILLKVVLIWQEGKQTANPTDEMSAKDLLEKFVWHTQNTSQMLIETQQVVAKLDDLVNAIGRDGDNSMLGQIRLLRVDFSDNHKKQQETLVAQHEQTQKDLHTQIEHLQNVLQLAQQNYTEKKLFEDKLWSEMQKVTDSLAKSATEQIIDALRQVIQDFNERITEQFGENFKQLNNAVGNLLTWQENYKTQLEQMIEQYQQGVQAIDSTKDAVQAIETSSSVIPEHMKALDNVIIHNQQQLDELTDHLNTFAKIRESAVNSLPEIQQHIRLVLDNMQQGSQDVKDTLTKTANDFGTATQLSSEGMQSMSQTVLDRSKEINSTLSNQATHISQAVETWHRSFENSLQQLQTEFSSTLKSMADEQERSNMQVRQNLNKIAQDSWTDTANDIKGILEENHKGVQKSQTDTLESMGKALVSITKQFTSDYRQLVEEMDKVIRLHGGR